MLDPHNTPPVTFVTAFIDLNEDRSKDRSPETRVNLFRHIANSGVSICLYVSSKYEIIGKELEIEYDNIKLMPIINLEDTETYKLITSQSPNLPTNRLDYKDTINYMIIQNSKSELVYNVTLSNPFNTEHFAWIDFSIFHMVTHIEYVVKQLELINANKLLQTFLVFPSCWSKDKSLSLIHTTNSIYSTVNWRFCGSFFIGDLSSIQNMYHLSMSNLPHFIHNPNNTEQIIAWEINFWAWLEAKCNWEVSTYQADHNNSILDIPHSIFIKESKIEKKIENQIENQIEKKIESSIVNTIINNTIDLEPPSKSNVHNYIDKVIYINLEHRTDRREEIETELNSMNIDYERFNAISNPDFGIVGCTQSHLEIFKMAKEKGYKNILIFEDDFKFIVSKKVFEEQIELLYQSQVQFDICMLGYRLLKSNPCHDFPFLQKAIDIDTTSCYIINESMYDTLIDLYEWTLPLLIDTRRHWIYALDQIWKLLQPISKWYIFNTRIGIQRPSYSDLRKQWDTPNY